MSIVKTQKITHADLMAVIAAVNNELNRHELDTIVPPSQYDVADDTQLDTLATKIVTIRDSHCYCQTNSSMVHSGCPSYTKPSLVSSQVDEGVPIVASEGSLPDVLDIQTDLAKMTGTTPCQPQCGCVSYCYCYQISNRTTICPSQCNCDKVCDCETACECDGACSCDGHLCGCQDDEYSCDCQGACSCDGYSCDCQGACSCDGYYVICPCAAAVAN